MVLKAENRELKPTPVVLVHGAWHGAWCWERVTPLLDARGIDTQTVDLPSMDVNAGYVTDMHGDAEALRVLLDALDRPAVVLGHSYGGMVITEGAAGHPNAQHLVYLTAFMPDAGESVGTLFGQTPNPDLFANLVTGPDGRSSLNPACVGPLLYNDCDADTVAWATSRLRSMLSDGAQPARAAAWRDVPSTYVICSEDKTIPPTLQRSMSARATEVVEWPTSHSPFASQPQLVADLLARLSAL
jgi:pimeloyl-ACP methyl ester carboxylesterase